MHSLRGWICLWLLTACSATGFAEAPPPDSPNSPAGKPPLAVAAPSGGAIALELASGSEGYLCGEAQDSYLMLSLAAAEIAAPERAPMNLAVVIDRSGSMASEDKLEHVKSAASFLVSNLQPSDRLALISYDDKVDVVVPSQRVGRDAARFLREIAALSPGNTTNIEGGLLAGYAQVRPHVAPERISRVLLLSDGLANVGVSDPRALGLLARKAAESGVSTTAMGVGVDYSEDTMMQLAELGRGNYHFIGKPAEIPSLFARELRELKATLAKDAVVSLELPQGAVVERVYGYDQAEVGGKRLTLPIGDLFSGDSRRIVVRVRTDKGGPSVLHARAEVRFSETSPGTRGASSVASAHAALRCVGSPAEVHALARPEVQHEVKLVTSAEAMDIAMRDVAAGRKEEAKRKLDQEISALAPAAAASGSAALGGQVSTLRKARAGLDALDGLAESASEVQAFVKGNRAQSKAVQKRK